jgi:protein PhnA
LKHLDGGKSESNGNILEDGDNVHVIKDLKVKGMSTTLKRGVLIKKNPLD